MNRIEQQIQARVESFVEELTGLVRQAALQSVSQALAGPKVASVGRLGLSAKKKTNSQGAKRATGRRPGPRGPKRTPETLAKLQAGLLEEIQLNPGQRMEAIGQTLGMRTKDLDLLIKKLLVTKKIKKRGNTRATTYYAT